ncbi:MAG: sulfatase family protein [Candidatus Zipacnadales bacterium]
MSRRPNILLLFTDQQRADTIAELGNPYIQTPTLDSLVREGVSFTSCYTPSPVCMAARCSLLLGQWPHQTGCTGNTPMPQNRTSLMELLQGAGYQTHGVGKMHFGPDRKKLWGFEARDFSEEGGWDETDDFCLFLREHGFSYLLNPNGVRSEFYYVPQPSQLPAHLHNTTWIGDRSVEFLRGRDRSRPFFLWSSFIKPHPPFENPIPWLRLYKPIEMPFPFLPPGYQELLTFWNHVQNRYKYRDQGFDGNIVRLIRAQYFAAISFVDYNLGRILDVLRQEGELDHTLVIFTSDHGELLGDYGSYGKRSLLDPASRVPLLVRYPERFPQGHFCNEPVSLVDVMPTCLAAAGLDVPDELCGLDLAELVTGASTRKGLSIQFNEAGLGLYGWVTREYKYAYSAPDHREWLFRRAEGQPEECNLAGNPAYQNALEKMRAELINHFRSHGYETPLEGDRWKVFPTQQVPSVPDAWQLFQEGGAIEGLFPPGYAPRCQPQGGLPFAGI